jgi:hypothetical protein
MAGIGCRLARLLLSLLFAVVAVRQEAIVRTQDRAPDVPTRQDDEARALLTRHLAAVEEYKRAFADLIGDETHLIEVYDEKGKRENRRTVVSDLLVYASSRDETARTEYRDVREVDGRVIKRHGLRAIELLAEASEADSLDAELATIDAESDQYAFNRRVRGFTINQGSPDDLRSGFAVEITGREQAADHEAIVLTYRQTSPNVQSSLRLLPPLPAEFGGARLTARGRLWLDAATAQLWHSVWELVAPHPDVAEPLIMVHTESTYVPSRFGILVPDRIVVEWRDTFTHPKKGPPQFLVKQRDTFTYASFRRFETRARVAP